MDEETDTRTQRIIVRVSAEEHRRAHLLAAAAGMSLSEWVRGLIESAARTLSGKEER